MSLAAQEARLRAYATMADLELVAVLREEGVSASKQLSTRPAGAKLAELVATGQVGHVLALKLDRLFRDAVDALTQTRDWDRAGVAMHLMDMGGQTLSTGGAIGRMFLTMVAAFAELERNLISERTTQALQHLKAQGRELGQTKLEHTAGGAEAVARARELHAQGLSLREIAEALTEEGHRTKRGGRWAPETVRKILKRAA